MSFAFELVTPRNLVLPKRSFLGEARVRPNKVSDSHGRIVIGAQADLCAGYLSRPHQDEPIIRTLTRNLSIAIVAGVVISVVGRAPFLALPGMLVALWPSLGGHFVEIAFLDGVRPRLPRARLVHASARVIWWLACATLLGGAMIATAHELSIAAPRWRWWWMGAPLFVGLELGVHAALAVRGRPSFYRGDG